MTPSEFAATGHQESAVDVDLDALEAGARSAWDSRGQGQRNTNPSGSSARSAFDSLASALLSTEGGASLSSIQSEYRCSLPLAYLIRGLLKATATSGFPALVDIAAGVVLLSVGGGSHVGGDSEPPAATRETGGDIPGYHSGDTSDGNTAAPPASGELDS